MCGDLDFNSERFRETSPGRWEPGCARWTCPRRGAVSSVLPLSRAPRAVLGTPPSRSWMILRDPSQNIAPASARRDRAPEAQAPAAARPPIFFFQAPDAGHASTRAAKCETSRRPVATATVVSGEHGK